MKSHWVSSVAVVSLLTLQAASAQTSLISIVSARAPHEYTGGREAVYAINGANLNFLGGDPNDPTNYTHTAGNNGNGDNNANWLCGDDVPHSNAWFAVDLGSWYSDLTLNFFNFGVTNSTDRHKRGVAQADIYYRALGWGNNTHGSHAVFDKDGWTLLKADQTFTIGVNDGSDITPDTIDLGGAVVRYIAFDVDSNHGDNSGTVGGFVGIGEVQFFGVRDYGSETPQITNLVPRAYRDYPSPPRLTKHAIDGSGINVIAGAWPTNFTHTGGMDEFGVNYNWMGGSRIPDVWYAVDMGRIHKDLTLNFFNFGVSEKDHNKRGIKQADIYYSTEGWGSNTHFNLQPFDTNGWTLLAADYQFDIGPSGTDQGPQTIRLGGIDAQYLAFDVDSNHGGATFVGIGEIQLFGNAVNFATIFVVQ